MSEKFFYEELLPDEFEERMAKCPLGYLPLGTIEWHGPHNALGADAIQSRGLFAIAAERYGGIVFPPLWVGPDRIQESAAAGEFLIGMDSAESTTPKRQLPGSCYWIPKGAFITLVESILAQAKRAGFKCVIADGHGPSRRAWDEMVPTWEKQFGLALLSPIRDFGDKWKTQNDHAAKIETSEMLALRPDLVRLGHLPADPATRPQGVGGEDPRLSSAEFGMKLIEETVAAIGAKLKAAGFISG
jgi:creatinine amidohydrolase